MTHRASCRILALGFVWALAGPIVAFAAAAEEKTASADEEAPAAEQVEIVVTGSRIPTPIDKVAAKVTIVDAQEIEKAGVSTDVLDILRKTVPSFQGRGNTGNSNANNTNQNTAGGAQLQLHNLDTLVLVNGRRVAISGIAAIGGKAFVDVNQIPPSAIDHIEVLADGASAIYGSDAIGGVVNIILKSNYDGADIGIRDGEASGDYRERSAYFTAGTAWHDLHITLSGSWSENDPLYQNRRSFSTPLLGRVSVVPGTIAGATPAILAPGLNTPSAKNPTGANATAGSLAALIANGTYLASTNAAIANTYDISQFQTLLLGTEQKAISVNLNDDIIQDRLIAFGDAEFSRNTSFTQFLPITQTLTVPQNAPFDPLNSAFPNVNFADWNLPKQFDNTADAARVTAGLRGNITSTWNWEAAYVYSRNTLDQTQSGVIYKPNLPLAIAGGFDASGNPVVGGAYSKVYSGFSTSNPFVLQPALDPFARAAGINPASIANVFGQELIRTSSFLHSFDASIVGTVFKLPAGEPGVALGVSWRQEGLTATTDPNGNNTGPTAQRWIGGTFADAYAQDRTVKGAYAELRIPVTSPDWNVVGFHALDLIFAGREEDYTDAGSAFVPKLSFRWQPIGESLTVRGSYSKSFTAPTLFAESGPTDTRIVGSAVIQSVFGIANPGFNGEDGNNPNLRPSKTQTHTLSLTFTPKEIPGLLLAGEFSAIHQSGFPGGIGFTNILQNVDQLGAASPFANNLAMGNFPGLPGAVAFTTPGQVGNYLRANPNNATNLYAIDRFQNLGGLMVKTFTLNGGYELPTARFGTFSVNTAGTVFDSFEFQALPYQAFYQYAGFATNGGTGVQGTLPKYRFYTTFDWRIAHWDATLANTYASSVTDIGAGGIVYATSTTSKPIPVASYTAWDVRLAYTGDAVLGRIGKSWSAAIGINNIANRLPPLSPQAFTDNNADVASYSPIGRLVYVTAGIKF
ncbi:MAG TPA: TonB-dependent receptor plug domain-containing protein [Steroidobacteraceae bacterium]|nr:TonB-dependent receptor plug domain-containing protein [Steroidobacteraceae bacterium]